MGQIKLPKALIEIGLLYYIRNNQNLTSKEIHEWAVWDYMVGITYRRVKIWRNSSKPAQLRR